jgi:hypothetical protein
MFWFISPWEAARCSLEAQRQLMALPWMFMASGRRYQGLADGEGDFSEAPPTPARSMATAVPAAVLARRAMETIKGPVGEAPPTPARSMATAGPAAVPARRAMETIKGPVGARGKNKRSKRKNKSRKK